MATELNYAANEYLTAANLLGFAKLLMYVLALWYILQARERWRADEDEELYEKTRESRTPNSPGEFREQSEKDLRLRAANSSAKEEGCNSSGGPERLLGGGVRGPSPQELSREQKGAPAQAAARQLRKRAYFVWLGAYCVGDLIDSIDGPIARATGTATALGDQLDHKIFDKLRTPWLWASLFLLLPTRYQFFWLLVLFRIASVGEGIKLTAPWKVPILPMLDVAWYTPFVAFYVCGGFSQWRPALAFSHVVCSGGLSTCSAPRAASRGRPTFPRENDDVDDQKVVAMFDQLSTAGEETKQEDHAKRRTRSFFDAIRFLPFLPRVAAGVLISGCCIRRNSCLAPQKPLLLALSHCALEVYIGLMFLTWGLVGASSEFRADIRIQCLLFGEASKCAHFQ
eukprot:TRINITY_DN22695_c0_g1_i1.p1 TRINITY_DN22695_c0_g1~~TRINITY_DN22695_c0_g1_i1.p1  ORF type:complete len:398 (-),score=54.64 TRINITY_DN22695_c0_g1_i1:411-1604(-)